MVVWEPMIMIMIMKAKEKQDNNLKVWKIYFERTLKFS
jgi:hypothetical protein